GSVISDRAPSEKPPRYAAETPTSTESAVANPPTANAITSDCRVLQISCDNTSWPYAVVPNQCCQDGPRPGGTDSAFGSTGAISHGKIASTRKKRSKASPASALRLCATARQRSAPKPRRASAIGRRPGPGAAAAGGSAVGVAD